MEKLFKNSFWIFLAQSLVKAVSFLYTIYLARSLGVEGFGLYSTALAYFSLFSSISDIGLSRYLIREGARDYAVLNKLLSTTIIIRLLVVIVLLSIAFILLSLYDHDPGRRYLSVLAMLAVIPQSIALTFDGVLVAVQRIKLSSIGVLFLSVLTTSVGFLLVEKGFYQTGAISALVIAEILYAVLMCFFVLNTKIHFPYFKSGLYDLKKILLGSLPYGILGILGLVYFKVDTLFLSYLRGSYETGLYTVGYRFLEALVFIPSAVATAAFPVLSTLHDSNQKQIKRIYFLSVAILGGIAIGIMFLYIFILPIILPVFLPQYLPSIEVIKILAFTLPFMFVHVPGAAVLLTSDKYLKQVVYLSIITLGFNVIANLIFIPQYGLYAAAWITVASETLSFGVFFWLLYNKILRYA